MYRTKALETKATTCNMTKLECDDNQQKVSAALKDKQLHMEHSRQTGTGRGQKENCDFIGRKSQLLFYAQLCSTERGIVIIFKSCEFEKFHLEFIDWFSEPLKLATAEV